MSDETQNTIKRDEATGDVVEAQVDEVIQPGDPRHGVHGVLPPERDALSVQAEKTPEEIFAGEDGVQATAGADLPESDLEGADGRRGPVVRNVTTSGVVDVTPEQVFTAVEVDEAETDEDREAAEAAKAEADALAEGDDGGSSRTSG